MQFSGKGVEAKHGTKSFTSYTTATKNYSCARPQLPHRFLLIFSCTGFPNSCCLEPTKLHKGGDKQSFADN